MIGLYFKRACRQLLFIGLSTHVKQGKALLFMLFMLLCAAGFSHAKTLPDRINFQHLLENKDIVLGEVAAIYQDREGFMWLGGANGLIRYDGYNFKTIRLMEQGDNGLEEKPVKSVANIYQDEEGILWVSTRTGLLRYTPVLDQLRRIQDTAGEPLAITGLDIEQTLALPSGELLVGTKSGLLVLDRTTLNYKALLPDATNLGGIQNRRTQALHLDKKGNLWLGTDIGLEKVDWERQTFTLIKPYPQEPDLVPANSVTGIVEQLDGTFWLATFNGLLDFDPKTLTSTRYVNDPNNPKSLSGNDIWMVMLDSQGALWVASDGGGVSVLERGANDELEFTNHMFEPGRKASVSSNQVRTVFEDSAGDVWVGNYPDGINYFDRASSGVVTYINAASDPNSLSHNSVLSLKEDAKGNLWLGTDGGGLNYFDRTRGIFTAYKKTASENSIASNAILSTYLDEQGVIWAGTWGGGVSKINPVTGIVTRLAFDELRASEGKSISQSRRLNNAHVWSIKEDGQKNLWIATHDAGLSKYDRASGVYTHYWPNDADPDSITTGITWDTFEDSKGNFWVATSMGLDLMDRDTGTFKHYKSDAQDLTSLSNPSVLSMHEDTQGRLWFGTDSGLNLFDDNTQTFKRYTKADGFNDDTIRQILEAEDGRFWISTNNGVSVFEPETGNIKNYNRDSGLLVGGFHTDSGLITKQGEVVFGGINGVRFYLPEKLTENQTVPPVAFTDFKLFADSVVVGDEGGLLSQSINHTNEITLDYKKSMIVFEFSALNFRDSGKNEYAYKLEGFDENWLEVGSQREAKYTNLNAGRYTFKVRGSNNDGVWNKEGTSITLVQLPPPWKTWWAYLIYACIVLAGIAWFLHHQRQKRKAIEAQNRMLEAKVSERTVELSQKNHDIQAMLENMPQGLFTVQEGGMIHPEYSHYLESIFNTHKIAGEEAYHLLFGAANLGSDTLDAVKTAIFAIVGEDELSYGFNSGLLIKEYDAQIDGKTKYLSLDWNPIIVDGVVNKLMVSVRDVTQLKEMESEAAGQKRELDIISQLLNLSSEKVMGFEESSSRYVASNRQAIEDTQERDEEVIALLFRNMHTIKGNCRTYGFTHISDVVHEVESTYSAMKADPEMLWDGECLLDDLDAVEKALAEYTDIYHRVLGRGQSDDSSRHDGFWMHNSVMNKIEGLASCEQIHELRAYIGHIQSRPVEEVLVDVVASLSSIAAQLGKRTPTVKINTDTVRIKNTAFELMTDVFAHVLRNCVDHGIESGDERVKAGKDEWGNIQINAMVVGEQLNIFVNDDGQGINLSRLYDKGVELGHWKAGDEIPDAAVAELVFCSGVSTKEAVTDISGRGVGMDAVKKFLISQGGNVALMLQNTSDSKEGFVPFELVVTIPSHLYVLSNEALADE